MIPYQFNPLGLNNKQADIVIDQSVPFTIQAMQDGSVFSVSASSMITVYFAMYINGTYVSDASANTIREQTLNKGDKLSLISLQDHSSKAQNWLTRITQINSKPFKAYGNAKSLIYLNYNDTSKPALSNAYLQLFYQSSIYDASQLLFRDINKDYCMYQIFYRSSLVYPPLIYDSILDYYGMGYAFLGCANLKSIPDLSTCSFGLNSGTSCFASCTSLTSVKLNISEITISSGCNYFFSGCSNLNQIQVNFTNWTGLTDWVNSVASSGTFIKPSELPEKYGGSYIPDGWTVINKD